MRRFALPVFVIAFLLLQGMYAYIYANFGLFLQPLLAGIIRLLIWVGLPALYLLLQHRSLVEGFKLKGNLKPIVRCAIIGSIIVVIFNLVASYVRTGGLHYSGDWSTFQLFTLIGIISEELLFRGFLLSQLRAKFNFRTANIFQAVLFMTVHIIGWLMLGTYLFAAPLIAASIFVLVFALTLGWVAKRTDSVWAGVVTHIVNNLMVALLHIV